MGLRKGQTNSGSFKKGEHRSKITEITLGTHFSPETEFGKIPPWNKGLTGDTYKNHYKNGLGGLIKPGHIPHNKGKLKPGKPLRRAIRDCFKMTSWRNTCMVRDDFTCRSCGKRGGRLNCHHIIHFEQLLSINNIKSFQDALECDELWNINNGKTLCIECHKKIHNLEGYRR